MIANTTIAATIPPTTEPSLEDLPVTTVVVVGLVLVTDPLIG